MSSFTSSYIFFLKILLVLIFSRKQDLNFHANCLHWRQFALRSNPIFLGKNKKNVTNVPSAESDQSGKG